MQDNKKYTISELINSYRKGILKEGLYYVCVSEKDSTVNIWVPHTELVAMAEKTDELERLTLNEIKNLWNNNPKDIKLKHLSKEENAPEKKYFTPNIEDIRVGYECEHSFSFQKEPRDTWSTFTIPSEDIGFHIHVLSKTPNTYRTPYLTKEQIEAEGWEFKGTAGTPGVSGIRKGDELSEKQRLELKHKILCGHNEYSVFKNDTWYRLWYYCEESRKIRIIREDNETLFLGECKDINTFRYICKLLNI